MIAFAHHLSRPYVLVLLAGALHPSPLRRQLDMPVLSLPLARDCTLLDAWLGTISRTAAPIVRLVIVVSSTEDAQIMRGVAQRRNSEAVDFDIEVMVDPSDWRGPAGLLRDIAARTLATPSERDSSRGWDRDSARSGESHCDTLFACAEAAVLPPPSLDPLLARRGDPSLVGAIGAAGHGWDRNGSGQSERGEVHSDQRPAGVYVFNAEAIMMTPSIGFHDIKEQLLPSLYRAGRRVPLVPLMRDVIRIRDLDSYLRAMGTALGHANAISSSPESYVSDSAILSGPCIVQDGVIVEDGAVIHESILMRGAHIGGGSVIARSVIGPGAAIGPRSVVRGAIATTVTRPVPRHTKKRRFLLNRSFPLKSFVREESRGT